MIIYLTKTLVKIFIHKYYYNVNYSLSLRIFHIQSENIEKGLYSLKRSNNHRSTDVDRINPGKIAAPTLLIHIEGEGGDSITLDHRHFYLTGQSRQTAKGIGKRISIAAPSRQ